MTRRNLMRACGENRLPVAVLSFLAGFIIGQMRGYYYGAADQARLDALVSPEGQEHLRRELQQAPTNALPVVTPK